MVSDFVMLFSVGLAMRLHQMACIAVATQVPFTSAIIANAPVMGEQGAGHSRQTRVREAAVGENRQAKAARTRAARMAAKAEARTRMQEKGSSIVSSISSLRLGRSFRGTSGEGQVTLILMGSFALQSCRRGVRAALMMPATSGLLKVLVDRCRRPIPP